MTKFLIAVALMPVGYALGLILGLMLPEIAGSVEQVPTPIAAKPPPQVPQIVPPPPQVEQIPTLSLPLWPSKCGPRPLGVYPSTQWGHNVIDPAVWCPEYEAFFRRFRDDQTPIR
jgi:hypothetical protein